MESSISLLTVKYLAWRSTLYTAVCQCYFDIKAAAQSESFARRGLAKINELDDIEKISTSERTPDSEAAFRQAKTKMQVMIFRRVVFETRKRPKGLLRPKTKPNLKDSINVSYVVSFRFVLIFIHCNHLYKLSISVQLVGSYNASKKTLEGKIMPASAGCIILPHDLHTLSFI